MMSSQEAAAKDARRMVCLAVLGAGGPDCSLAGAASSWRSPSTIISHSSTKSSLAAPMMNQQQKEISLQELDKMQLELVVTLCLLEKFFPSSFFNIMIHLTVHLTKENTDEIVPYIKRHKQVLKTKNPGKRIALLENEHSKSFAKWLREEVKRELVISKDSVSETRKVDALEKDKLSQATEILSLNGTTGFVEKIEEKGNVKNSVLRNINKDWVLQPERILEEASLGATGGMHPTRGGDDFLQRVVVKPAEMVFSTALDVKVSVACALQVTTVRFTSRFTHDQVNHRDFEEIQGLYHKEKELVDTFIPIGSEEDERRIKDLNTKAEEESSNKDVEDKEEQQKTFLSIVPNEEEAIDYEVLDKRVFRAGIDVRGYIKEPFTAGNGFKERKYPLTKETLKKMLVLRLTAESESEAAFDLLRFIQKQIDEILVLLVEDFAAAEVLKNLLQVVSAVRVNINTVFNYNAKLSDFGLTKDGPADGQSHVSTRVMDVDDQVADCYLILADSIGGFSPNNKIGAGGFGPVYKIIEHLCSHLQVAHADMRILMLA
ncbi:copia protein [Tanacetum coccineum]